MTVRLSARFFSILLVALLSILGMALVLRATPEGLTLSDDSIAYIAGARSMVAGQGYREAWLASNGPVTHFPPAYPGVLAFLGWFGLDPLRGARLLAAVLYGLNAVLLGILGWRMTRWLPAGILLSLMFVLNDSLLRLHASALSEPLFIFLTLLSFWMFDLYHERDSHWLWLVACGTLVGAAYLTRYAALALAATIVIALLLLNADWRRRLVSLGIFVASLVPWIAGWAYRNYIVAGTATNRVLAWHPVTQSNLDTAWRTLAGFLLPLESWRQEAFRSQWLLPVVVLLMGIGLAAWLFTGWRRLRGPADAKQHEILSLLNGLYVLSYVASILAAIFLFDASTKFKLRILAPAFVSAMIVLVALAASAWGRRRAMVIVLGAVIVAMSAYGQAGTMNELMKGGQGYAAFRWYDSNAMAYLRLLPDEVAIYTNEPGAVYLYTDRPGYVLPDRVDPVTAAARPGFDRGRRELQLEVQSGRAVLALFSGGDLPADDGAALSDGLYLLHKSSGTEIYGAPAVKGTMSIQEKFDLKGRTAIVTGGVGLLGSQFCRTLAEAGAAVAILDLDPPACDRLRSDLVASGAKAAAVPCDLRDVDSIQAAVASVLSGFGSIDILVNSAAMDPKFDPKATEKGIAPGRFEDYPLDQWNAALQVNLTGPFLMTQACVKSMIARGSHGSIINICSTYGLNGPDQRLYVKDGKRVAFKPVYYTVTKAGVLGFTRYLAAYYAGTEIRVNALTPGGVFNDHEEYFVQNYSARTILGRMARPDEMNGALLFLASDASSYMTGANLVVDGGWTAW